MSPTLVAVAAHQDDEPPPLYSVSFTNGALNMAKSQQIGAKVYQQTKSESTKKIVISAGGMDYAGNFLSSKDEGRYVGVEDPETGKVTLIPLKQVRLRPAISITQEFEEEIPEPKRSRQEQHDSLIDSFGGAKQKQNMLRRQKHGINKEMIYDALDAAGVEELPVAEPITPSKQAEETLPPHDTTTTDPDNAYPLDGYLPEKIRNDLVGFVEDICDVDSETLAKWKTEQRYPSFVISQLERLPLAEHQRKSMAVLVKYLSFLIHIYKLKVDKLRLKDPFVTDDNLHSMPASCLTHILQTFTTGYAKFRTIPMRLKDKVLVTILLLALRLELNTLSCDLIMADLKVGMKKIVSIAKAMGCKVKMDKTHEVPIVVIRLTAPLQFPKESRPAKPKKR